MKTSRLFAALLAMATVVAVNSCKDPVDPTTKVTLSGIGSSVAFDAANPADVQFLIQSSDAWTVTAKDADWLTVSPGSGEAGKNVSVTLSAQPNVSTEKRECTLTIESGTFLQDVAVSQSAADASVVVSGIDDGLIIFAVAGGSAKFSIESNVPWTAQTSGLDWCTVTPLEGAPGTTELALAAEANPAATPREGTITIKSSAADIVVMVAQDKAPSMMKVDKDTVTVAGTGGNATVVMTSNVTWTATPSDSWVTVSPATGSGENVSVTITAAENPYKERISAVTFKAEGEEDIKVVVCQPAGSFQPYVLCEWNTAYDSPDEFKAKQPKWPVNGVKNTYNPEGASLVAQDGVSTATWKVVQADPLTGVDYTRYNFDGQVAVVGVWVGDGLLCECKNVTLPAGCTLAFYTGVNSNGLGKWAVKFSFDGGKTWNAATEMVHLSQTNKKYEQLVNKSNWDVYGKIVLNQPLNNANVQVLLYAENDLTPAKTETHLAATSDPTSVNQSFKLIPTTNSFNGVKYSGPAIVVE